MNVSKDTVSNTCIQDILVLIYIVGMSELLVLLRYNFEIRRGLLVPVLENQCTNINSWTNAGSILLLHAVQTHSKRSVFLNDKRVLVRYIVIRNHRFFVFLFFPLPSQPSLQVLSK
jgi:hypothetical protein